MTGPHRVPHRRRHPLALAAWLLCASAPAWAQTLPDAGSTVQDLRRPPPPPAEAAATEFVQPPATPAATGGPTVVLRGLRFQGQRLIDADTLAAALADAIGPPHDLAGLRALAARVDALYRDAGYPFVRTVLPPQTLDDGELTLQVIEGRYGRVLAEADTPADAEAAAAWLAPLQPGEPIAAAALERATLLLADLPGVRSRAVLRPGDETGTGDLVVALAREPRWVGELGLDNHGNRYSGAARLQGRAEGRTLLQLGDRLEIEAVIGLEREGKSGAGTATGTDGGGGRLRHGVVAYGLPLGGDGWRARASAAHTDYALGREFAALGAQGQARVLAAGLGFVPVRRSATTLAVQWEWQHKRLADRQDAAGLSGRKHSHALPLTMRLDHRDDSGRVQTWGTLVLTPGQLTLDPATAAADRLRTAGRWQTLRLDVVQRRALGGGWSLQGRVAGQWADRNLDASEGFSLGGPYGVRAYPAGEAPGDMGWLTQLELRRGVAVGSTTLEPFVFHDHGQTRADRQPLPGARLPSRTLAGSGIGLRAAQGPWWLEAQLALRTQGGPAQSVPGDGHSRAWVSVGRRF